MNILELCLSTAKGGLELYALRAAVELSKSDNVAGVIRKGGALEELFNSKKIKYITLEVKFKPFPVISALKLAKVFAKKDIDVVHVHWVKDLPLVALAKKISRKKPKIVFTRQMQITRNKKDIYHQFVYKEIDKFIAITNRVGNDLNKYLPKFCTDKIEVLYYGVPEPEKILSDTEKNAIREDLGISKKTFLIGLFGRIKKAKGQYILIDAVRKMYQEDKLDVTALIVGHPMKEDYMQGLKKDVVERGLQKTIVFKGFVDEPQSLMQACDVIVLATYEETFGLVLAEAMRAGVAVIGSNSGGVPEIIDDMVNGLLFTTKDADDLYRCLKIMEKDRKLTKEFASKGKEKANEMFDYQKHFIRLKEIISR